jgi:hypothetical protein
LAQSGHTVEHVCFGIEIHQTIPHLYHYTTMEGFCCSIEK